MARTRPNVLVLVSDEHSARVLGCAGHVARTPNLDRLAAAGTRFTRASTNCPICVPARAALATGRYAFEIGCWDNAFAYAGRPPSWAHAVSHDGMPATSIGKLHFRSAGDDVGFVEQIEPMHLRGGIGDLLGAVRDPPVVRPKSRLAVSEMGPGESGYTRYDRRITDAACRWLERRGRTAQPWLLYVGWVAPHFPLIVPPEFFSLYDARSLPLPKASAPEAWPRHPWVDTIRECFDTDRFLDDALRRTALAAYYGLVSWMDHNVGRVLGALEAAGGARDTLVLYTSDHGDNMGTRGLWGKSTFYDEAISVPLIARGPGFEGGARCGTPVSLVDVAATIVERAGCERLHGMRGESLASIAARPEDGGRTVFAEYHAAGTSTGGFMVRDARHKYVHYVGMPPQLFDLERDPEEMHDAAADPSRAGALREMESRLRAICDPEKVDARAKADQRALVERHGGRERVVAQGGFGATPAPAAA
jgi:choline-sulfatase